MKVNVDLSSANNIGTGICTFENEIVMRLAQFSDFELYGATNYRRNKITRDFERFSFPTKYSMIPYKMVYNKKIPINYEFMIGNNANVNLFCTYNLPLVNYKKPVVSTIHDLILQKARTEDASVIEAYEKKVQHAIKVSDHILTVSNATKTDLMNDYGLKESDITVVYNGVVFDNYNTAITLEHRKNIKRKYNLPDRFFLYFGANRKHKNIPSIIRAYALLPADMKSEVKLVITNKSGDLISLAKSLGVESDVVFTGFIDEEDKVGLYQMAEVSVFVSYYEGFGIPVIESMAAGTPVITSNTSSLPEAAGAAGILVNPYSVEEISEAMNKIVSDKDLYLKLKKMGIEHSQNFSWDKSAETVRKVLKKYK